MEALLFIALAVNHPEIAWKSRRGHDGEKCDRMFIAGLSLPQGQITYHLPDRLWDLCQVRELTQAPQWDGHTSQDVIDRLMEWIRVGE